MMNLMYKGLWMMGSKFISLRNSRKEVAKIQPRKKQLFPALEQIEFSWTVQQVWKFDLKCTGSASLQLQINIHFQKRSQVYSAIESQMMN